MSSRLSPYWIPHVTIVLSDSPIIWKNSWKRLNWIIVVRPRPNSRGGRGSISAWIQQVYHDIHYVMFCKKRLHHRNLRRHYEWLKKTYSIYSIFTVKTGINLNDVIVFCKTLRNEYHDLVKNICNNIQESNGENTYLSDLCVKTIQVFLTKYSRTKGAQITRPVITIR